MKTGNRRAAVPAASRYASVACIHVAITLALIGSIVIVSMGVARAQNAQALAQPDTGLVLALTLAAIGAMCALSALAMRLAGRPRQR